MKDVIPLHLQYQQINSQITIQHHIFYTTKGKQQFPVPFDHYQDFV